MANQSNVDAEGYAEELGEFRQSKDEFFAGSPQSPLPQEERDGGFEGLSYYPPNLALRVEAEVVPFEKPDVVQLATSTGEIRPQLRYAELRFRLGDRDLKLIGFAEPHEHHTHELFVPFRDATSGRETYGAGRYLEVEVDHGPDGETAVIDFNLAYNPYCAYSPYYSCPVPPAENTLPVAITAGERNYEGGAAGH
ncbi:MAG: DUF1684 domain-containing protein [Ktedonobacterales bacterium]